MDSNSDRAKQRLSAADALTDRGLHAQALPILEDLLAETPVSSGRLRGQLLTRLSLSYARLGQAQHGLRAAHEAVQLLARHSRGLQGLSRAQCALSFCYTLLRMGHDALEVGLRALHNAREAGSTVQEAWALNRMGLGYESLGDLSQAALCTHQSLEIAQGLELPGLQFSAYNNLCFIACSAEHEAQLEHQDARAQAFCQEARRWSDLACRMARASGNVAWLCTALGNRVYPLLSNHELPEAEALIDEYLPLAQEHSFSALVLQAQLQRATLLQQTGQELRAIAILRSMLAADLDRIPPKLKRRAVGLLVRLHKQRAEYHEALQYLEQLTDLDRRWAQDRMNLHSQAILISDEVARAQAQAEHANRDAERERERAERLMRERESLSSQAAELSRIAVEDVLTGLYNRRHADQALPLLSQRARAQALPLSLAMLDLDHFKQINDSHGHAMGDQVLQIVAQHMRQCVRTADLLARLGGEEFVVALVGAPLSKAHEICERMRKAIAAHDWQALTPGLSVSVSIGLVCARPDESHEQLLERADQALYAAKRLGRNQVHVDETSPSPEGHEVPTAA